MRIKTILIAALAIAVSFVIALKAMDWLSSRDNAPVLVQLPPLPAVPRTSTIVAPIAITLDAIRDAAELATPKNFAGKAANPVEQLLQNADISWTAARGPIAAAGAEGGLTLAAPLTGTLNITGSLSSKVTGAVGDVLGSLLGANAARQIGSINIKNIDAAAEIKGNVAITARPQLTANWRLDPNLAAQVDLSDTSVSIAGARLSVPAQMKPLIDKAVNEQLAATQARLRNDPALENNARAQWGKMCRSIPLQRAASSLPPLWLEMRPTRAIAAQPRIEGGAVMLTLGLEAETRITPAQTQPDCPFPAALSIVPPSPGRISIALPIDMPFTELSKLLEAQFAGKNFPEDGSGAVAATVRHVGVAASGDRLLITLLVDAVEKKSLFGFGGQAHVHIWGRPVLDQAQQTLRLTDIELAVESKTAFGLLGSAAQAAAPFLQKALAERAVVDLKPFAANAEKRIAEAIADFKRNEAGIRIAAEITALRLTGIAFDSQTLRVIAELNGGVNVSVTALPGL